MCSELGLGEAAAAAEAAYSNSQQGAGQASDPCSHAQTEQQPDGSSSVLLRVQQSSERRENGDEGSSSESSGNDSSIDEGAEEQVMLRIVPEASMVQPGQRAACSMPVDMNNLQESIEGLARLTNRR